jgi:hypothetical protein
MASLVLSVVYATDKQTALAVCVSDKPARPRWKFSSHGAPVCARCENAPHLLLPECFGLAEAFSVSSGSQVFMSRIRISPQPHAGDVELALDVGLIGAIEEVFEPTATKRCFACGGLMPGQASRRQAWAPWLPLGTSCQWMMPQDWSTRGSPDNNDDNLTARLPRAIGDFNRRHHGTPFPAGGTAAHLRRSAVLVLRAVGPVRCGDPAPRHLTRGIVFRGTLPVRVPLSLIVMHPSTRDRGTHVPSCQEAYVYSASG